MENLSYKITKIFKDYIFLKKINKELLQEAAALDLLIYLDDKYRNEIQNRYYHNVSIANQNTQEDYQHITCCPMMTHFLNIDSKAPYNTVRRLRLTHLQGVKFSESTFNLSLQYTIKKHFVLNSKVITCDYEYPKLSFSPHIKPVKIQYSLLNSDELTKEQLITRFPLDGQESNFRVFISGANSEIDVKSFCEFIFVAPHSLVCGGSFMSLIKQIIKTYELELKNSYLSNIDSSSSLITKPVLANSDTIINPFLSNYPEIGDIKTSVDDTTLSRKKMDFYVTKSFSKLSKTQFTQRALAVVAAALQQTMKDFGISKNILVKCPINIKRFCNPPISEYELGAWIRQKTFFLSYDNTQSSDFLSKLTYTINDTPFVEFPTKAQPIDTLVPFLGYSNLGKFSILSDSNVINVHDIDTVSNMVATFSGKWQIFVNGQTINDETTFSIWTVDPYWTKEEKECLYRNIDYQLERFSDSCKLGFNYSDSGIVLGYIKSIGALNIPVKSTNREDFQCPTTINDNVFLEVIQKQEDQYYKILSQYSQFIKDGSIFMPAAGSLLNFVSTLFSLKAGHLICSDLAPESSNKLSVENIQCIEDKGLSVTFLHGTSVLTHIESLLLKPDRFNCIILPWFSMYLSNDEYQLVLDGCSKLLNPDGIIFERYSAAQAFNQSCEKLSMKTEFRPSSMLHQFYKNIGFSIIEDSHIEAFHRWTHDGQRYLIAKKTKNNYIEEIQLPHDISLNIKKMIECCEFTKEDIYKDAESFRSVFKNMLLPLFPVKIIHALKSMSFGNQPDILVINGFPQDEVQYPNRSTLYSVKEKVSFKSTIYSEACLLAISSYLGDRLYTHPESLHTSHIHHMTPDPAHIGKPNGIGTKGFHLHVEGGMYDPLIRFLALIGIEGDLTSKTVFLYNSDILEGFDESDLKSLLFDYHAGPEFKNPFVLRSPIVSYDNDGYCQVRLYENSSDSTRPQQMYATCEKSKQLLDAIQVKIQELKKTDKYIRLSLQPGQLVVFNNGISKGRIGGVLHTREGDIQNMNRFFQRIYIRSAITNN